VCRVVQKALWFLSHAATAAAVGTMSGQQTAWHGLYAQAAAAAAAGDAQQAVQLYSQALAALRQDDTQQEQYKNVTMLVAAKARALIASKPGGWEDALMFLNEEMKDAQGSELVSEGLLAACNCLTAALSIVRASQLPLVHHRTVLLPRGCKMLACLSPVCLDCIIQVHACLCPPVTACLPVGLDAGLPSSTRSSVRISTCLCCFDLQTSQLRCM
jgi:hypothetical protein